MNEGGNGVEAPQAQGQVAPQPAQPTSAVNAGFDASRFGSGKKQKPEKVKKVKGKKNKESKISRPSQGNNPKEKTKRPIWFWIILAIFGVAVVGAIVWAITALVHTTDGTLTELTLEEDVANGDGIEDSAVANYISQLQQIYDANSAEDSETISSSSDGSAQEVSKTVEKALETSQGKSQADLIRFAEMAVAYNNSDYERAGEVLDKVNPDKLSIKDQIYYYAIAETIYERSGDNTKAQEAFSTGKRLIQQLCSIQECKQ